jgi:hypothetical protein
MSEQVSILQTSRPMTGRSTPIHTHRKACFGHGRPVMYQAHTRLVNIAGYLSPRMVLDQPAGSHPTAACVILAHPILGLRARIATNREPSNSTPASKTLE